MKHKINLKDNMKQKYIIFLYKGYVYLSLVPYIFFFVVVNNFFDEFN
jgi:hypothetical protein